MIRPSFASTIHALLVTDRRFPWVEPSEEEADVAAVLADLEGRHQGNAEQSDSAGHWGRCTGCGEHWPCPRWVDGEHLAIQYLGRAADRVYAHARSITSRRSA